jgi:hypothetical protein
MYASDIITTWGGSENNKAKTKKSDSLKKKEHEKAKAEKIGQKSKRVKKKSKKNSTYLQN